MTVAWYWTRAEFRQRGRTWLAIALVVGLSAGIALACLAGARRTDSAYPRFLEWADPPDFTLDPDFDADTPTLLDRVESVPGVAGVSHAHAVALGEVVDGSVDVSSVGTAIASVDGERFYERDRVHVTAGRLPDPGRIDEVLVSESLRLEGVDVGDVLHYVVLDVETLFGTLDSGERLPADAGTPLDVTVTGIGVFPERVVDEEGYSPTTVLVTPAMYDHLPDDARLWSRVGVYVDEATDPRIVQARIKDLAASGGGDVFFEDRADITDRAQRAIHPYVLALAGLGVAGVVFTALVAVQLVRRTRAQSDLDRRTLLALSADRRQRWLAVSLPAASAALLAAVTAIVAQLVLSSTMPVGPVRTIEPDPGISVDWVVMGPGLVALAAALVLPSFRLRTGAREVSRQTSGLAGAAARAGAPLSLSLGLGRATGGGDRARRGAARSGLVSVGLGTVMLVAVATFAASLDRLVDHPEVHGWNSDLAIVGEGGYGDLDLEAMSEIGAVRTLSAAVFGNVTVDGAAMPGLGVAAVKGELLHPPIVGGRAPAAQDEIALGRRSLAEVGSSIGDTVEVRLPGDEQAEMRIVGTTVLPGLGPIDNDRPSLGHGALVVVPPEMLDGDMTWSTAFVDLHAGADKDAIGGHLLDAAGQQPGDADLFHLFRPADVAAFAELGSVPFALVMIFGVVALASLAHVLLISARSWRRDRAVLAALGAAPRQLRSAVRWQAVFVIVLSLVAALPTGAAIGRWAWHSLATEIGIDPQPVLPAATLSVLVVLLVLTAVLVTSAPERRTRRRPPAESLRTE